LTIGTIKNVKKKKHQEWVKAINKIMPKNPSKKSKIIFVIGDILKNNNESDSTLTGTGFI
jgi:hypothetical protein